MKSEIYAEVERLESSENILNKKRGRTIRITADTTRCFTCLDTRKFWKDRDNMPWCAADGRGYYDIIGCTECNNCGWITCSYKNVHIENDVRIYHKSNRDCRDRIEQLYNKGHKDRHIMEEVNRWIDNMTEPVVDDVKVQHHAQVVDDVKVQHHTQVVEESPLFEVCKRISRDYIEKSSNVEVEVGKIVDMVKDTVEAYFGNVFSLIDLCKELKVSFFVSDSQTVNHDKIIKISDNNYLGIKTCTKITQNKISTGLFSSDHYAKEYSADIFILKPTNQAAIEKSNMIMSKIATDMTDDILSNF